MKSLSRFVVLLFAVSAISILAAPASSSAITTIHFIEFGVGDFNRLYATSLDPIFANPGFSDFTDDSHVPVLDWNSSFTARAVEAWGSTRDNLVFTLAFDDAYEQTAFSFDFYAYEDGVAREWATVSYNGLGMADYDYDNWTFEAHDLNEDLVPEPASFILLGSGLIGLAGYIRRLRQHSR